MAILIPIEADEDGTPPISEARFRMAKRLSGRVTIKTPTAEYTSDRDKTRLNIAALSPSGREAVVVAEAKAKDMIPITDPDTVEKAVPSDFKFNI